MSKYGPDPEGEAMAIKIREKWAHRILTCETCGKPIIATKIRGGIRDLTVYVDHGSKPGQAQAWHTTYQQNKHREHQCV